MPKVTQPGKGRAQIHSQNYLTFRRIDGFVLTVNRVLANAYGGLLYAKPCSKHLHVLTHVSLGGGEKGQGKITKLMKRLKSLYYK